MKKIIMVLMFLIVVGCDLVPTTPTIQVYDPYHGSDGIVVSILDNAPPEEAHSGRPIKVGVKVENKGAYDTQDLMLALGINSADLTITGQTEFHMRLTGKSTTRQYGERDAVFWDLKVNPITAERTTDIIVETRYRYQTNAIVDVCIDPDVYNERTTAKACTPKSSIGMSNQGAPMAVTSIEQTIIPDSDTQGTVEFEIEIENVGEGDVHDGSSSANIGRLNYVNVNAKLSHQAISCNPSNLQINKEGIWTTKCTANYDSDSEYQAPLHVQLNYVYRELSRAHEILLKP